MKNLITCLAVFSSLALNAQYYFNDLVSSRETSRQMKTYADNKVQKVTATGFNPEGQKHIEFSEIHEVLDNGKTLKIINQNPSVNITYYRFDNNGNLLSVTDSTSDVISFTQYVYDEKTRVVNVQNTLKDGANDFTQVEVHKWTYNSNNQPVVMWRTINNSDSLEVRFMPDENGNPGEERTFKRGVETGVVYYYFDEKNRLSDIVRYNKKAKRLLPDYMFEYDENDRVIQKITTTSSLDLGYLIWRNVFNEKGLKTKEALFNKDKQMTGKIEYVYSFKQ
jgi:hypothetical protein